MKIRTAAFLILACAPPGAGQAQTFDLITAQLYEPIIGSNSTHNARAVALGGAYSVLVRDASALWYNPAALARLDYTELQAELDFSNIEGQTLKLTGDPLAPPPQVSEANSDLSRTRMGSIYLAVPLSGSASNWALGFGMAITNSVDRALAGDLEYQPGDLVYPLDTTGTDYFEVSPMRFTDDQRGVVRAWQVGVGGDVSRTVMIGATGVYYRGSMDFTTRTASTGTLYEGGATTPNVTWNQTISNSEKFWGWGLNGGVLIRPTDDFAISGVIRSPVTYTYELDQYVINDWSDGYYEEYAPYPSTRKLQIPLVLGGGVGMRLNSLRLAGEVSWCDWSQTEYRDAPYLTQLNDSLRMVYNDELALAAGAEVTIPQTFLALRAGVRYATLPYNDSLGVDDRLTLSGGIGFVVDRVMAIDLAASWEDYRGSNPLFGFDEKYKRTRVLVTAAYRFP